MPHVIVQNCCNDASCVPECPVDCIHPTPDEPDYATAEMLYIDPDVCIDCGACIDACPVSAITTDYELTAEMAPFETMNADYYEAVGSAADRDHPFTDPRIGRKRPSSDAETLRVAVVGAGAAGHYVVSELQHRIDVRATIDVYERLPETGGLVRFGVAPDHADTKKVQEQFAKSRKQSGVTTHLGVRVGEDVTHEDLARSHHAVVYAVGSLHGRELGLPGADLPGVTAAADFVAWYNGHPDFAGRTVDLSHERVVVLGNGNVALDVARILTADPETFTGTDMTDEALAALRDSRVREVVILARRGPEHAAFTAPELVGLARTVPVVVEPGDLSASGSAGEPTDEQARFYRAQKLALLQSLPADAGPDGRRVVLRFGTPPTAITASDGALTVAFDDHGAPSELACGAVLPSIGLRGTSVPGVPYDEGTGTIPNADGRVLGPDGAALPGVYVAGWCKRGPTGVIGTNRYDARGTVDALIADFHAGLLSAPSAS
ncbi:FAD-dependent oxidoreductase [Tsukamurella paurometabola]|uniref:ferredoxin--NADP(+) reductase n=1 Tax=Tsukamurella paurometabola TaxID=2061 RepID=A0A3P8MBH9_TSUPA|nr:FAD-dependent oxidoreductase [Tsukamurella paurometabola]MBS4103222.1 FAD-dependent oxidoreductase [Tsukamurella paurometabola]UEA85366.1 FAD-dependent oxidoreductase [Tsukamurella paurometabola]VDR37986.1 NADPH-ferredoxin reductase fprA [Tsukamurella paurometabola]